MSLEALSSEWDELSKEYKNLEVRFKERVITVDFSRVKLNIIIIYVCVKWKVP